MDDRSSPIIIIKKKKKRHEGHHGGSWKVAYADFVTAMMAFFLLLWLITMVSPEKRLALSEYFKNFNIFKEMTGSGQSFMERSAKVLDKQGMGAQMSAKGLNKDGAGAAKDSQGQVKGSMGFSMVKVETKGGISSEDLVKKLKTAIEEKLKFVKNQVFVDVVEGGVRIQIVDMEGSPMFTLGSADPTVKARQILALVSDNIRDIPNRVAIEGHTDSAPFRGGQITNWELSTSRASAARRELEDNGIEPSRIARVVGYADQELYVKEDPRDPRNRRISIILIQQKAEKAALPPAVSQPPSPLAQKPPF
ncbi:MAG: OmpA family protein [Syntrophaceae bacterium]|nr:OmpA family protein [Syntrophaceae bacterium]